MSYLNTPRLTFSGQFQADASTVNNDPLHYNNKTFKSSYQDYSSATDLNGWWNPDGTGNWKFIGCKITSVTYQDGTSTKDPLIDPIIGMSIKDTESRTAGKIVDLDTQQQMVSELWGLVVRIVGQDNTTLMRGDYEVAPFINIWFNRSVDQSGDGAAAALYQSVIKNISWNNGYSNSRYINELKAISANQLSIKFTVDRFKADNTDPQFTLGRIAGSIGPSSIKEPEQFVLGRQLFPQQQSNCNYATALVDEKLKQVVLDFSNSLQFNTGGIIQENRDLRLAINNSTGKQTSFVEIGKINYSDPDWYMDTSGIFIFSLNAEQFELIQQYPIVVIQAVTSPSDVFTLENTTSYAPIMIESAEYVRADRFVFRLNPKDRCSINFYATKLGKALPNTLIEIQDASQVLLAPPADSHQPEVGKPPIPLFSGDKPAAITADENGKAVLTFTAPDPGNPRGYIDGQIYGLSYNLSDQVFSNDCNQANFISIQIYSGQPSTNVVPDWENFIQQIMQQYANLYPLMSKGIFNLADKNVVDRNAQILKLVFSKDPNDPNYMPATRDLSAYKKRVILDYLQNIIDNDNPSK